MFNLQIFYKLIVVFLYSCFATYVAAYYLSRKFKQKGFVKLDKYKKGNKKISDLGGTSIFIGVLVAIVLSQLLFKEFSMANLLIFYFIVIIHATFGLLDDLINLSNKIKIIAPYFMALPIALLVSSANINLFNTDLNLGLLMIYFIAPVYLMVVTNLVNMHSGFNGLASGVSLILLIFLGLRTVLLQQYDYLFYLMPILGAVLIYHFFDKYPAKMLWGNVGSLMTGAAIGSYIILTNAWIFGIVLLLPHIVDFLMYIYSVTYAGNRFLDIKYGSLRKDGTIKAPTPLKLKFLFPYYFKLNERKTVWLMYLLSIISGSLGLVLRL